MTPMDNKAWYRERLDLVRQKRSRLPPNSHIRMALSDEVLRAVHDKIETTQGNELNYNYWPPVYGLADVHSAEVLALLDSDIDLVTDRNKPESVKRATQFLRTRERDKTGPWYGGLFDIWAKASAHRSGYLASLDYVLPNGRDHDILLNIAGQRLHLESTVITQDDESQAVWDRFLVDKRLNPDKVLMRPGAYCPVNAKGPSPYYDALRVYAKVYDKLAKDLNPDKSQLSDDEANILLLSFSGVGVDPYSPSVAWVLDELFANQPKMVRTIAPDGLTDISLEAWVEFTANQHIRSGKMTVDYYCEHSHRIISAPRRLSAVLLFDGCKFATSRINYNAFDECRISHRTIVALEDAFRVPARYWL